MVFTSSMADPRTVKYEAALKLFQIEVPTCPLWSLLKFHPDKSGAQSGQGQITKINQGFAILEPFSKQVSQQAAAANRNRKLKCAWLLEHFCEQGLECIHCVALAQSVFGCTGCSHTGQAAPWGRNGASSNRSGRRSITKLLPMKALRQPLLGSTGPRPQRPAETSLAKT
ncbi:unnamed protein product [Durusdinium trenchii]|uniref:Uncharacterized protein n=1 Tax=Durusdinium trenchii TaxID=1381693 RepID=A0ABP0QYD3_9DINO